MALNGNMVKLSGENIIAGRTLLERGLARLCVF